MVHLYWLKIFFSDRNLKNSPFQHPAQQGVDFFLNRIRYFPFVMLQYRASDRTLLKMDRGSLKSIYMRKMINDKSVENF